MTKYVDVVRRVVGNTDKSAHLLDAIAQGIANQASLINDKTCQLIDGLANHSRASHQKLDEAVQGLKNQSQLLNDKLTTLIANQQALLEAQRKQTEMFAKLLSAMTTDDGRK